MNSSDDNNRTSYTITYVITDNVKFYYGNNDNNDNNDNATYLLSLINIL